MQLLNPAFVILVIKIAIGVVPIALGVSILVTGEDKRREIRNWICNRAFGVSNAIAFPQFSRTLNIVAVLMILAGLGLSALLIGPMVR